MKATKSSSNIQYSMSLFALLFSLYLLTFSGRYHSSDEISMLVATDSLARRGAWDIELLRWMGEQQGSFGPDGHLYSRKGIGTTLATLPFYWLALQDEGIGNVRAAMLTNACVTALTGVLVFLFLRRLRYGEGVSLGVALAFGLGTMAWPYARYLFSESLAGLGLMACAYFLLRYRDTLTAGRAPTPLVAGRGSRLRWIPPLLAGVGLGLALLARLNNAIVAPFLGLLLLAYLKTNSPLPQPSPQGGAGANSPPVGEACPVPGRHRGSGEGEISPRVQLFGPVLLFGLPVLAALAATGWYNWLRFGSPLATGYLPEENFATPFFEGFYGLTFSPGKGLFWYNPLLLAALAAWPAFLRKRRAEALLVAAVVLSNVAFYAPWYLWWAGHSWGPRFLVTILPFAVLPLAAALEAAKRHRWLVVGLAALALLSVAVQLLGVAVDFNLYLEDVHADLGLYHPATLFNPAYSPLLRQWAYLRAENLDLAWARGGAIDWRGLACGLVLVGMSSLALWAAWRRRLGKVLAAGGVFILALGVVVLLLFYTPGGDVAEAAVLLARMERPDEAAALTDPLLTEAWQDAYDGKLWVWGTKEPGALSERGALWTIGPGDPEPAAARFQVGAVRLDYYPPPGQQFDDGRIWGGPSQKQPHLGNLVQLVANRLPRDFFDGWVAVQRGGTVSLTLYWRALTPMETSYTAFVQLVDETGVKAAQVDRLPCHGGCPTDTWRPGDLVGERYDLLVSADAPPGSYQIIVGMYDLDTGENLLSEDGQPYLTLGSVQVEP